MYFQKMTTSTDFINAAYDCLGYSSVYGERLLDAADSVVSIVDDDVWIDKGDWLSLAKEVEADRIFFLNNNPVIVFARLESDDWEKIRQIYNRIWSMARPRLLFLAKPGELAVYDLAHVPPKEGSKPDSLKPLGVARSIAEVSEKLAQFHREEIESGHVFEAEMRFGDLKNRADKQLIHDLKAVRRELISLELGGGKLKYAHALIGRSIFIRYLEDRGILKKKYFEKIVNGNSAWQKALDESTAETGAIKPIYPRVLKNHDFTFALFRQLAEDFNGDMFPDVDNECKVVKKVHLDQIHDLMYGEVDAQKSLFFYAYDFKVIPVELISSIYEEFYHEQSEKAKEYGAIYTPPALAEFVVSQTLTPQRLATNPRVMDPACGSGIFLVESFRRIVRHRMAKQRRRLRFDELRKILREQLAGIDVNPEAIRVAAFSLYLAMLHYLEPPDILQQIEWGNRLPNLIVDDNRNDSLNILLPANAFDMERIESDFSLKSSFGSECADVVIGNPPWGSVGSTKNKEESRAQNTIAMDWCKSHKPTLPVGDQERSQTFIWRSLDMLKPDGVAGLLVSTGVFFKHHIKSVDFRRKWLSSCSLDSVFNFSHCRNVFFKDVHSPFSFILFHQVNNNPNNLAVQYWSAKRTKTIEGMQSIVLSRYDLKQIPSDMDLWNHWVWKVLWWGTHQDERLIRHLKTFTPLRDLTTKEKRGQGYKKANQKNEADWLKEYKSLPIKHFRRYGSLNFPSVLEEVPYCVERRGVREVYDGLRLLFQRGIEEQLNPKGQIVARLEKDSFCFTNAIIGVKLPDRNIEDYKVVLGVIYSSLARYFFFLTTAMWGIWHHEIEVEELLSLPICLPQNINLNKRILSLVEELQTYDPPIQENGLFAVPGAVPKKVVEEKRRKLEFELDNVIFELYGLNEAEIDLIRDMCDIGIDFYYNREKSIAVDPMALDSLKPNVGNLKKVPKGHLGNYIRVFAQSWSAYMDPGTEMHWEVRISPKPSTMLAIVFTFHDTGDDPEKPDNLQSEWDDILCKLDKTLGEKMSSRIYLEGLARAVSDDSIIIIKRNELRFWTKSMAREDAEGALVQSMQRNSMNSDIRL